MRKSRRGEAAVSSSMWKARWLAGRSAGRSRRGSSRLEALETRLALTVPVANPDVYSIFDGQTLDVPAAGVLANDSDAEGDPLHAVLVSNVANGSLTLRDDGSFVYTPNAGFSGADSFTYKVRTDPTSTSFTVNSAASSVTMEGTIATDFGTDSDSDSSSLGGTLAARLSPNIAPFSQIQVSDLDVTLLDAVNLDFQFGVSCSFLGACLYLDSAPGGIAVEMITPGAPAAVGPTGQFLQTGNDMRLSGVFNVDATGLAEGSIPEGPTPFDSNAIIDFSGTITQNGNTLTLTVPISVTGSEPLDPPGQSVTYEVSGNIVATATVLGGPEESATVTVTINVQPHINARNDVYRMREDGTLVVSEPPIDVSEEVILPAGSFWRYLDNGSDQGTAWRAPGFNDSTWLGPAPAQFGYGEGDEATVVSYGADANNKFVTTYFRRAITIPDPETISELIVNLQRDDGAAVFINGVEVVRDGLAEGATFDALADNAADDGQGFLSFERPATMLVPGVNTIAVEVHQSAVTSSDVSFDLELLARRANRGVLFNDVDAGNHPLTAELVTTTTSGALTFNGDGSFQYTPGANFAGTDTFTYRAREQALVPFGSSWRYLANGTDQGTSWYGVGFDDSAWLQGFGQLGYGDGDEATNVLFGGDANNKYVTTYFRKTFNAPDPTGWGDLKLRVIRDDGVAIYINGVELGRDNLDAGAAFNTLAGPNTISGADESTPVVFNVPSSMLVPGQNTIAVEIHQQAVNSSDISFDLALDGGGNPRTATATILVAAVNDAPNADADGPYSTPAGVPLSVSAANGVLAGDSDVENTALQAVLVTPPPGSFTLGADGSFQWTPAGPGPASFTYRAREQSGSPLVPFGSNWRIQDDGSDQGTAWRGSGFDDSSWWVGPGELGYGDGDEATVVRYRDTDAGTAGVQKNITTYFRHTFQVADASKVAALALQATIDDGAAFYLNGTPLTPHKLNPGALYTDLATGSGEDDAVNLAIDPALLVNGANVLAVEVHQRSSDSSDLSFDAQLTATLQSAPRTVNLSAGSAVVGRRIFYNNSRFDQNQPAANSLDDGAIAPDKSALLPGGTATFANYTSYSRGINGIMVDVAGLAGAVTAADFTFRVGNDNAPAAWVAAPAPVEVTVRAGAGVGGSSRVTLTWADGAIKKQWLQVTVRATANTGLAAADVFYFGNAVGETGNSTTDAVVNAGDEIGARVNSRNPLNPAPIDFKYDFTRDGLVNAADQITARVNSTNPLTSLRLIAPPPEAGDGAAALALAGLDGEVVEALAGSRRRRR